MQFHSWERMEAGEGEGFYSTFQNRWQGGRRRGKIFSLLSGKPSSNTKGWDPRKSMKEDIWSRVSVVLPCPTQQCGKSCHCFGLASSALRVCHKICLFWGERKDRCISCSLVNMLSREMIIQHPLLSREQRQGSSSEHEPSAHWQKLASLGFP